MRNDVKIKRLIRKYGLEGYGLYNIIVESIADALTTDSPIPELEETANDLAENYKSDTIRIEEMTNFMIEQGLFEINEINGHIICNKIYKFIDKAQTRSEDIRNMIESYKASLCQRQKKAVTNKTDRIEQNRKEKKIKEKKELPTEIIRLSHFLYDRIPENLKPTSWIKKPPDLNKWAMDIEYLNRIDGVPVDTIEKVIEWAMNNKFWQEIIRSGSGLRRNFNTIEPQMNATDKQGSMDKLRKEVEEQCRRHDCDQ